MFANKARLEKKKYTLHPGLTDFMDRFLEEQEGSRDRSSSPSQMTYNITIGTDNKINVIIPSNFLIWQDLLIMVPVLLQIMLQHRLNTHRHRHLHPHPHPHPMQMGR